MYAFLALPQGKGYLYSKIYDAVQAGVDLKKGDECKLQNPGDVSPTGTLGGL